MPSRRILRRQTEKNAKIYFLCYRWIPMWMEQIWNLQTSTRLKPLLTTVFNSFHWNLINPLQIGLLATMDEWTIKTQNPICRLFYQLTHVNRICGILFNRFYCWTNNCLVRWKFADIWCAGRSVGRENPPPTYSYVRNLGNIRVEISPILAGKKSAEYLCAGLTRYLTSIASRAVIRNFETLHVGFSISWPVNRICGSLTDFIDWRYIHSWFVFSTQLVNCCPHGRRNYMVLVYCCHSTVPFLWPPPLSPPSKCSVYTDSVWLVGGGGGCWNVLWTIFCRSFTLGFWPDSKPTKFLHNPKQKGPVKTTLRNWCL